jgi:hypothetical protein
LAMQLSYKIRAYYLYMLRSSFYAAFFGRILEYVKVNIIRHCSNDWSSVVLKISFPCVICHIDNRCRSKLDSSVIYLWRIRGQFRSLGSCNFHFSLLSSILYITSSKAQEFYKKKSLSNYIKICNKLIWSVLTYLVAY